MKQEKIFNSGFLTIILFLFQIIFGIVPGWKKITADFPNYYVSAKMLAENKDLSCLYDNICFNSQLKEYGINVSAQFALYPPPNALVLLPIEGFHPLTAKRIWLTINFLLIFFCSFLIKKIAGCNFIFSLNVLLLSGFALANDLFLGQVYLFVTVLLLSGYLFFERNKNYLIGLSWGTVLSLKYVPFIFIPSLILKKKWKMLLSIIVAFLFINLICLPFFGLNIYESFLRNTFFSHVQGKLYEGKPFSLQYQSWESLLNNLFVFDINHNPHPFFDFPFGYHLMKFIVWLFVIGTLVYFHKAALHHEYFFEIIFSLSMISLLILEPGSATYHILFMILPCMILLKILNKEKNDKAFFCLLILFALIGFLPTLLNKFSLFHGGNIVLSFPRLWLEMLFYFYSVYLLHNLLSNKELKVK